MNITQLNIDDRQGLKARIKILAIKRGETMTALITRILASEVEKMEARDQEEEK